MFEEDPGLKPALAALTRAMAKPAIFKTRYMIEEGEMIKMLLKVDSKFTLVIWIDNGDFQHSMQLWSLPIYTFISTRIEHDRLASMNPIRCRTTLWSHEKVI
jgi:hypothetical protein